MLTAFEAETLMLLPFMYCLKIMQAHVEFYEDLLG
jgi:hypothetical protein